MKDATDQNLPLLAMAALMGLLYLQTRIELPGWLFWLLLVIVFPAMVMILAAMAVVSSIARKTPLRPVPERKVRPPLLDRAERLKEMGYVLAGPALRAETNGRGPGVILPMTHETGRAYAVPHQGTGSSKDRITCDLISELDDGAQLITSDYRTAGSTDKPADQFVQVVDHAAARTLHGRHEWGLRLLEEHGLQVQPARPERFEAMFTKGVRDERDFLLSRPFRHGITLLRRLVSPSPDSQPLSEQIHAREAMAGDPSAATGGMENRAD